MALSIQIPQTSTALTGIPVIADNQWALFEFKGYEEKPGEKGITGCFRWELVQPAPGNQGKPIEPGKLGSKWFDNVYFFDKNTAPGQIPERCVIDVSKRIDGCLGTGDPANTKNKPERPGFDESTIEAMRGKKAWVKMKVENFNGQTKNSPVEFRPEAEPPNAPNT